MMYKGIVLAGGKSSRFGEDKALARLDGITLLERAVKLLRELNLEPLVITNALRNYSFLDCPVHRDRISDKGPLGGLYTACQIFPATSLLVLACDMPGITPAPLRILLKGHDHRNQATLFRRREGGFQPFPGIYRSALSDLIFARIKKGEFSLESFLGLVPHIYLVSHCLDPNVFMNVNERKDLSYWDSCQEETMEFKVNVRRT